MSRQRYKIPRKSAAVASGASKDAELSTARSGTDNVFDANGMCLRGACILAADRNMSCAEDREVRFSFNRGHSTKYAERRQESTRRRLGPVHVGVRKCAEKSVKSCVSRSVDALSRRPFDRMVTLATYVRQPDVGLPSNAPVSAYDAYGCVTFGGPGATYRGLCDWNGCDKVVRVLVRGAR